MNSSYTLSQKVLIITGIVILIVGIAALILETVTVFLLIFTGILLSVFLRGLANQLKKIIKVPEYVSLIIIILLLLLIISGIVWITSPSVSGSIQDLKERMPEIEKQFNEAVSGIPGGENLLNSIQNSYKDILSDGEVVSRITGVFSSTLGAILNIFVILIVGLYAAFDPNLYIDGIIKIVPQKKRERAKEVLQTLSNALAWWLVGRFASMFIVGILTIIGLLILDIPLPITLGLFAAILTFVPNIGPFISAVPPVLLGLIESPTKAFYVIILYSGIQLVESYLITPMIQKKAVSMPPALLISAQILMGILLGAFGLFLATPLMVVVIVLVQMLYIQDTLGDKVEVLGEK